MLRAFRFGRFYSSKTQLTVAVTKFTQSHEWISVDSATKLATVGITNYAQKELGDVVYVEVPQPETELSAKDSIGAVESVKAASDVYVPVDAVVVEGNQTLSDNPALINKSPEKDGWIAKIKVKDLDQLNTLMGAEEYVKYLKGLN